MKNSLAVAALLLAGAVAAPALADSSFDNDWYVTQLKHKGVDVVAVYEGAPGQVRAVVQTADGGTTFQYFDENTLAPVSANTGTNTRVMTKLDTGPKAPIQTKSLLVDDFFD